MILTGKCREEFEAYLKKEYDHLLTKMGQSKTYLYDLLLAEHIKKTNTLLTGVIIEFFQYKQIWERIFYVEYRKTAFMDSKHAINESIIKANELYNSKYDN